MKRLTREQQRSVVQQWKRAAPTLARAREEELAAWQYDPSTVNALLEIGAKSPRKEDEPNGLVEMQKWFMKFAGKQGVLPLTVREPPVAYAVNAESRHVPKRRDASFPARSIGNQDLLDNKWNAFFCSVRCPGNLILKAYDLAQKWRAENQRVIGGFHSPVEKEVLKIMLRSTVPVCIVLARSLPKRVPSEFRRPLDEGRLLLLSPFDAKTKRATQETTVRRNEVVAALAERVFVAYAAPGSKTETLCRTISKWKKFCFTFPSRHTENLINMGFTAIDQKT